MRKMFFLLFINKLNSMNFVQWIQDLFKDEKGSTSIKPLVAFVGALFLCCTMLANSYSAKDIAPSDKLVDAVVIITAIGMGADSLDKFSPKRDNPAPVEPKTEE